MPPLFRGPWRAFDTGELIWDTEKSNRNLEDRGFDFAYASLIFRNSVLERRDTRSRSETRFQAIGEVEGDTLFVVYTIRDRKCRVISSRLATPDEEGLFRG